MHVSHMTVFKLSISREQILSLVLLFGHIGIPLTATSTPPHPTLIIVILLSKDLFAHIIMPNNI